MTEFDSPPDSTSSVQEIWLNPPKPFTGKREELSGFLLNIRSRLHINREIYDNDLKKIFYALSFMNGGTAGAWKEQLIEERRLDAEKNGTDSCDFGTFTDFLETMNNTFHPYCPYEAAAARDDMRALRMGTTPIGEHITKFKMLVRKSEVEEDSALVIDLFRDSLIFPIQRRILELPSPPKTLKEWYEWASKIDNNRRIQLNFRRTQNQLPKHKEQKKNDNTPSNIMSIEKQTMMKKGLCFKCKQHGHISRNCPN